MKKTLCILMALVVTASLVACGESGSSEKADKKSGNEVTEVKADYPKYDTTKDLVDAADLIFTGKIIDWHSEMLDIRENKGTDESTGSKSTSKLPYTIYDIEVSKMYKGTSEDKAIQIKCIGGSVDGTVYESDMTNQMKKNGEYLFLATTFENSYSSLVNDTQALYDLDNKDNTKMADEILDQVK